MADLTRDPELVETYSDCATRSKDNLKIHRGQLAAQARACITYQSPLDRGSPLPLPRVSRDGWPAAADAKLDGRCEGIVVSLEFGMKSKGRYSEECDSGDVLSSRVVGLRFARREKR